MLNPNIAVDIVVRLSIVLAIGWLALRFSVRQNPRWSVLITRCMIIAGLGIPVVYVCLPATTLAVLPAPSSVVSEDLQTTLASPVKIDHVVYEESGRLPLEQTTNVISEPVIIETESRLSVPALRESESAIMVPQNKNDDLSVAAHGPISSINEVPPAETLVNDSTATVIPHEAPATRSTVSRFRWLGVCWLSGCFLLLLKIGFQIRQAKQLLRTSVAASESIQRECEMLARKLSLRSIPCVCVSTAIHGPCTAGLLRPSIFLPQSWSESLSDEERRAVLMHELSHIAGQDLLWDLVSRIVTALWWFHPLVWRLTSQHRLACEHMSDARAADSLAGIYAYRQMLAQWTLRRQGAESNAAVLAMADRSFMLRRLKWLEMPRSFETLGRGRRTVFFLIAVLISLSVASVEFIPLAIAQQSETVEDAQNRENSKLAPTEKEDVKKKNTGKAKQEQPAPLKQRPNVADIDPSQTTPRIVHVVDERDRPIAGAKVSVGWWEDNEGDLQGVISFNPPVTNKKGEVTIHVPRGAARAQISAEAPGYANAGKQYSLSGEPTLILKPGRIIRVKAVDTKGRLLNDAYPLLEKSNHFGREFKRDRGLVGYFTSPVVGLERRWMRVVDGSGEGPILFSDLIDVTKPEQVTKDGAILATLYAGIRLEGRLDDSVPRPIKNGCVELYINEGEGHRIGGGWVWDDTALVREDGTFEFDSLPAGGHVQLFALVDGYQSIRPSAESLAGYLQAHHAGKESLLSNAIERQDAFWPHLFPLPKGLSKTEVELPCVKSSSLDVTVVDPIGQPIEGASVKFNPNGLFLGGELFIPTTEGLCNAALVRPKDPVPIKRLHAWAASTFLNPKTDANGIAAVRNLPASGRQSYTVVADKYTMPIHPTSSIQDPARYAVVDLTGGALQRRTITMEKHVPMESRKVMVMNRNGDPIPDIKITVNEIACKKSRDNWELWSVQRFGTVASETTGQEGQVWLRLPLSVDNQEVARLRIEIQGRVGRDGAVRETLIIPRLTDGRVVVLTPSDQPPKNKYRFRKVKAEYLHPDSLLSDSPKKLIQQLRKSPSLLVLNRLLELSRFDAATPLHFRSQLNLTGTFERIEEDRVQLYSTLRDMDLAGYFKQKKTGRAPVSYKNLDEERGANVPTTAAVSMMGFSKPEDKDRGAVVFIRTDAGDRVIVLCDVRPKDSTWDVKPEGRSAPSAAFVFNSSDGSLIRMIGGWASSSGSYNNLMLTNQGGTDDYFISTSAFEKHGPFEYIQHWYRVGQEKMPALTVYNYANATSWDGKDGPSSPLAEYGYVEFGLNGKRIDHKQGGTLPEGVLVPRKIYWDGVRNQFIGPVTQSYDGQPLYQVVTKNSAEFKPLDVKPGDIVAGGGRRSYQNWHCWEVVVPVDKTAQLRLYIHDQSGDKPIEKELAVKELAAGLHFLQLQISDHKQDSQLSGVEIRIGPELIKGLTVPRIPIITDESSVKGVPIARTAQSSLVLFDRPTMNENVQLIWKLKLQ